MVEEKTYLDGDIIKLRQMYLEEKVNRNANYVLLENRITRLTMRIFLNGKFCMLCPECLEDITSKILETRNMENGAAPFSVLRTPYQSMMLALYEAETPLKTGETINERFTKLFPTDKIEETRSMEIGESLITWFSFKKTIKGRPFYHQVFSAIRNREMVIGHVHSRMAESGRFQSLMVRMLVTIQLYDEEAEENA